MADILILPTRGRTPLPELAPTLEVRPSALGMIQLARNRGACTDLPRRAALLQKIIPANYYAVLGQLTGYAFEGHRLQTSPRNMILPTLDRAAKAAVSAAFPEAFADLQASLAGNRRYWLDIYAAETYPETGRASQVIAFAESIAAEEMVAVGFPEIASVPVDQTHAGDRLADFTRWATATAANQVFHPGLRR